jgi:F0F1-type ATP synthase membrane subunit b/b'
METFTAIFTQLGVDSSLVYQFLIILVAFVIAQFLFLGKLQDVIETREEKTLKLESSADETIEKVQKMQIEYKAKIDEANRSALKNATEKKQKITQKYTDQYKQTEREVNAYVDQSRGEFTKEIASNKQKYLSEADTLAQSLVQKIIQ